MAHSMDVVFQAQGFCLNVENLRQISSSTRCPLTQRGGLEVAEWQVFLNLGVPHHHLAIENKTAVVKMV
jgi:hypothetical protein